MIAIQGTNEGAFGFIAFIFGLVILTLVLADACEPSENTAMRLIVDGEKRRWRALLKQFQGFFTLGVLSGLVRGKASQSGGSHRKLNGMRPTLYP